MLQDPLPYSQACENNKFAILEVLQRYISSEGSLLEIASGTGQHGEFTTESNAQFDTWLKERDPDSGVRDLESINALAALAGLNLIEDFQMPANNQLLVFSNSQYKVTAS